MKYKYKYLGRRGITIDGKDYLSEDIVELDKSLEESGLDAHLFTKFGGWADKEMILGKIENLKDQIQLLSIESEKEVKRVTREFNDKIDILKKQKREFEKHHYERFEPKKLKKVKKEIKEGGKLDGNN